MENKKIKKTETRGFTVLIAAAGISRRMKGIDKLLANLNGKPIIIHTLEKFENHPWIDEIVLIVNENKLDIFQKLIKEREGCKLKKIIAGGKARWESVLYGLKQVETDFVLIHDGARPLVSRNLINSVIKNASTDFACIPGLSVKETVKIVNRQGFVESTPPRKKLVGVQTPQLFKTKELISAYKSMDFAEIDITDDAQVYELAGGKIKVIPGEENNIKVTTPEDLEIAEFLIKKFSGDLNHNIKNKDNL
ncbi:MAG: 2-C-methyl-D-erythritol 4-phosphate cytidylyltransferase [Vulcanimicrobiota bacterium]